MAFAQSDSAETTDPRAAQPERPTVATHAHTVAPGYLEVETGVQYINVSDHRELDVPTLLKIGVTSHVQADLVQGYVNARTSGVSTTGLTDFGVAVKWRLLDNAPVLGDFAIQPGVTWPTASRRTTGTGTTALSLLAISSYDVGPVALDLNAGITKRTGDGSRAPKYATVWTVSTGWNFPGSARYGWVAEVFGYPGTSGAAGSVPSVGFLTGPTLAVTKSLVLDAGAIFNARGFDGNSGYLGLTWNLGR